MGDSKLPQIRPPTLPASEAGQAERYLVGPRRSRLLFLSWVLAVGLAVGVFILSQHVILSVFLGILGIGLFTMDQLVKKSLALTTLQKPLLHESPYQRLDEIRKQVSKCKFLEKVEKEGTVAADQAVQLVHQFKSLQSILDQKFEPTELTYSRYIDSIFMSCMAIAENLLHAKSILENLNLPNSSASSNAQSLWTQQREHLKSILEANAGALGELSSLYIAINEIMTKEKYRDQLEDSMQQIRNLSERTKQYSKH